MGRISEACCCGCCSYTSVGCCASATHRACTTHGTTDAPHGTCSFPSEGQLPTHLQVPLLPMAKGRQDVHGARHLLPMDGLAGCHAILVHGPMVRPHLLLKPLPHSGHTC